jgi:hypothetical protein
LNEIIRIPVIEYLGVFILAALAGGGLWAARLLRPRPMDPAPAPTES